MSTNQSNGAVPRTTPAAQHQSTFSTPPSQPIPSCTPPTVVTQVHSVPINANLIYNIHSDGRLSLIRPWHLEPTAPPMPQFPPIPPIPTRSQLYPSLNHPNLPNTNNNNIPTPNSTSETNTPNRRMSQRENMVQLMAIQNQLLINTHRDIQNLSGPNFHPDMSQLCQSIPKTDGDNPMQFLEFIIKTEKIVNLNILPINKLIRGLVSRTDGELQLWLSRLATSSNDWIEIKANLLNNFLSPTQTSRVILTKIFRYQTVNESLKQYIVDLENTAKALNFNDETRIVTHILDSANSKYLPLLSTIFPPPATFRQLYDIAKRADESTSRLLAATQRETPNKS